MVEYDQMEKHRETSSPSLRVVAFTAVVFSTVAVTTCLMTFPLVFHYVQTLQATIQGEVDFCKSRSRDMWKEMLDIHQGGSPSGDRENRLDSFLRSARQAAVAQCCTCQRGPPGAAGDPGRDGKDGNPGTDGEAGGPGQDAKPDDHFLPVPPQCDCYAPPGGPGEPGPAGPAGGPGDAGASGGDGQPGAQGPPGPPGAPGKAGADGPKGPTGDAGVQRKEPRDQPAHSANPVHQAPQDQRDQPVAQEKMAVQAQLDPTATLAAQVPLANQVPQVPQEKMVPQVPLALAPTAHQLVWLQVIKQNSSGNSNIDTTTSSLSNNSVNFMEKNFVSTLFLFHLNNIVSHQ